MSAVITTAHAPAQMNPGPPLMPWRNAREKNPLQLNVHQGTHSPQEMDATLEPARALGSGNVAHNSVVARLVTLQSTDAITASVTQTKPRPVAITIATYAVSPGTPRSAPPGTPGVKNLPRTPVANTLKSAGYPWATTSSQAFKIVKTAIS